jgi:hypothetical protein
VGVGQGIRESGVPREEIFVTTKIWNNKRGYEKTRESVEQSLERLGLDYLDMVLIHWPAAPHRVDNWEELNGRTWQALLLGPLYYIVIALPSVIWCNCFAGYRKKNNVPYSKLYCEGWADAWGQKFSGLKQTESRKTKT